MLAVRQLRNVQTAQHGRADDDVLRGRALHRSLAQQQERRRARGLAVTGGGGFAGFERPVVRIDGGDENTELSTSKVWECPLQGGEPC